MIPRDVRIGGLVIPVIIDGSLEESDEVGDFRHHRMEIRISPWAAKSKWTSHQTLLHECLHAIYRIAGDAARLGDDARHPTEEELVSRHEFLLHSFINDNRPFIHSIWEMNDARQGPDRSGPGQPS